MKKCKLLNYNDKKFYLNFRYTKRVEKRDNKISSSRDISREFLYIFLWKGSGVQIWEVKSVPNKIEPIRGTHIVIQITKHRTNYRYLNEIRKKTLHVKKKKTESNRSPI